MFEYSSFALYERFERKQGQSSLLYLKFPPVAADIFKNSSLQQKYRGFEINQQIVYTIRLYDHQLAMVEFKNLIL